MWARFGRGRVGDLESFCRGRGLDLGEFCK